MAKLTLLIGERASSEGSFQAWLAMREAGLVFETRSWSADPGTGLGGAGPDGPPVLLVDEVPVWGALAIGEFLAEHVAGLWPADARARAMARSVACEALGGLRHLRTYLPFDAGRRFTASRTLRPVQADVLRVEALWRECRERFGGDGPFLFGPFTLADAICASIALRLLGHAVPLDGRSAAYADAIARLPPVREWIEAARAGGGSGLRPPATLPEPAAPAAAGAGRPSPEATPPLRPAADPASGGGTGADGAVKPIGAGTRRRH